MRKFILSAVAFLTLASLSRAALTVTNLPAVVTNAYTAVLKGNITAENTTLTTAYLLFDLTDKGTATLSAWRGRVTVGSTNSTGVYTATVSNLLDGIKYFVRAAAKDATTTSFAANVGTFTCTTGGYPGTVDTTQPVMAQPAGSLSTPTAFFTANAAAIKSVCNLTGLSTNYFYTAGTNLFIVLGGVTNAVTLTPQ